ncbi:MAG: flavodoxin family protein [Theionarchaea archaeon]|nr:flavodoxin family protein [Theionarchaea archaeon]
MKVLVVYDSKYGNTKKIAEAIGDTSGGRVVHVDVVDSSELENLDLFIVGSPTHGGRPTPAIQDFLKNIPNSSIRDINVAAFDTRFSKRWVKIIGFAAKKIGSILKKKGGNLVLPPEGFIVKATKGPLEEGELERAANWSKSVVKEK